MTLGEGIDLAREALAQGLALLPIVLSALEFLGPHGAPNGPGGVVSRILWVKHGGWNGPRGA